MKPPLQFTVTSQFDENNLIEQQPYEVKRLRDSCCSTLIFLRHRYFKAVKIQDVGDHTEARGASSKRAEPIPRWDFLKHVQSQYY